MIFQQLPQNKSGMACSDTDYSNWMGTLPESLHTLPLNSLAIPGSHDSLSYSISTQNDIAPDTAQEVRAFVSLMGNCGKEIMYRWGVCQSLTVTQQLNHGIRYFDLRVAPYKKKNTLNFIHGLYGAEIKPVLEEINVFLERHSKEIVILDFNHLLQMTGDDHEKLMTMIKDVFGSKMCPLLDMESTTLESLWDNQLQVIVFYQNDAAKEDHFFWPASAIRSPWAETANLSHLMSFLDSKYKAGRSDAIFYVWQGVLTASTETVVTHFSSSLKDWSSKVAPIFVSWLRSKHNGKNGISICIMNFVECVDYVPTIVGLNRTLLE